VIRVLIFSPSTAVRQGLTALCQTEPDMKLIESLADAIIEEESPDITLIDGQDIVYGLHYTQYSKQRYPSTRIILLVEKLNSRTIWSAARAGAAGCILKEESAHKLLQTIRAFYE
jgi:DNA-binding NarL/FixJ family response regulator